MIIYNPITTIIKKTPNPVDIFIILCCTALSPKVTNIAVCNEKIEIRAVAKVITLLAEYIGFFSFLYLIVFIIADIKL